MVARRSQVFPADGHLKTHAPTQTITISNRPVLRLHRSSSSRIRRCWGAFFAQTISMICPYRAHIVRSVPPLASCVNQLPGFFRFCDGTEVHCSPLIPLLVPDARPFPGAVHLQRSAVSSALPIHACGLRIRTGEPSYHHFFLWFASVLVSRLFFL